jgi:hypothetical protein
MTINPNVIGATQAYQALQTICPKPARRPTASDTSYDLLSDWAYLDPVNSVYELYTLVNIELLSGGVKQATWQLTASSSGGIVTIDGDTGSVTGSVVNLHGGTTGFTFVATDATTLTMQGTSGTPQWASRAVSFVAVVNTGYFISAASVIATLPAAPANGSKVEFIMQFASTFTIQANTGQSINIGPALSSVAGTAVSTAKGDSVGFVFDIATSTWWAYAAPEGSWSTT